MVVPWAKGVLALAVAASATAEIDDRAALVQSAVKLHEQASTADREKMVVDTADMVRSFNEFLSQETTQELLREHAASAPEKVEQMAKKAAAKASLKDMKMEEVPSPSVRLQRIQEATFEDLPPELKFAVNDMRKGILDVPYTSEPLSMIKKHVPGAENMPDAAISEVPRLGKLAAEAFARGGPVVDDLIKQIPKLYRLVQDQSVFEPLSTALQFAGPTPFYNWSMVDGFLDGLGEFAVKPPVNQALQLFQSETGISSAQHEGASSGRGPCFLAGSRAHLEAIFMPGVRYYPSTLLGYYLQLNIGAKYGYTATGQSCFANTQVEIVVQRRMNTYHLGVGQLGTQPLFGFNLGGLTWQGTLGVSFTGEGNEPLKTIDRRHIDISAFVRSTNYTELPTDTAKPYKSTAVFNLKIGPSFSTSRIWAELFADINFVPKETIELKSGWSLAATPVIGFNSDLTENPYSDFHAFTKIDYPFSMDNELSISLGREATEGMSWNFGRY